ncbi:hypothetical protein BV25DRAFT_1911078 [Artomyces pyxidatus]|uniref:Uncharacterized protein n=1 Tax=Artomyces pyxidatus TaxID=48021 RepID=A0ACB8TI04_9AGAM|nr:hypothetical protein BV25DRAFT_1911078 [Artomyces pyxidatus]
MPVTVSSPSVYFAALYVETLLHGMYTVLCFTTLYILVFNRPRTAVNACMTGITVVMYGLATAHSALCLTQAFTGFFPSEGEVRISTSPSSTLEYTKLALEVINCLFGDAIVLWRVLILWRRNYVACLVPACLFAGSMATGMSMIYACSRTSESPAVMASGCGRWIVSWMVSNVAMNAAATGVVTYFAWLYRDVRRTLGPSASRPHFILFLLVIESGSLYCCTFAVLLILFTLGIDGAYILNHMIPQLTGIYPTLIIVLICLKLTRGDITIERPQSQRPKRSHADSSHSDTSLVSRLQITISQEVECHDEEIKSTGLSQAV